MVKRDRPDSAAEEDACRPTAAPKAAGSRDPKIEAFERWLSRHDVSWRQDLFKISSAADSAVAAGWGLLAKCPIEPGQELFRIPRRACLGATSNGANDGDAEQFTDSQQKLAELILEELDLGESSSWRPMLDMISAAPCPWVWPEKARPFLDGTELAAVLHLKMQRLAAELATTAKSISSMKYYEACALVISHANPWFGGQTLVPFNFMMNCSIGGADNVETDADGEYVVGRAVKPISQGEELVHAYTDSTAEMIYRYGFICPPALDDTGREMLLPDDSVCIEINHIPNSTRGGSHNSKLRALVKANALAYSAWDGLDDVVNAELKPDGEGTARLVGAALVFAADEGSWSTTTALLGQFGRDGQQDDRADDDSEDEDDEQADLVAALLVAGLCGATASQTAELRSIAEKEGGPDADPWPALLQHAPDCKALDAAYSAAVVAVDHRLEALRIAVEKPAAETAGTVPAIVTDAWRMSEHLRRVEFTILDSARELLIGQATGNEKHALA